MGKYILALDQGTTSSRAILFDREQNILGVSQRELAQHYPREGWVEQDAMEIWSTQYGVMMEAIARSGVEPSEIAAIGITNQRETTIVWDSETEEPVYNAIVWQDRRTSEYCDRLKAEGLQGQLVLQVHDELIVECPQEEQERVCALLKEEMEGVFPLSVPLVAETHAGQSWAESH